MQSTALKKLQSIQFCSWFRQSNSCSNS